MRFVPVKSIEQQGVVALHRGRDCRPGRARCWSTACAPIWANLASLCRKVSSRCRSSCGVGGRDDRQSASCPPGAHFHRGTDPDSQCEHRAADGETHPRLVPHQRGGAPAGDHSERRSDYGLGAGGHDHGSDVQPGMTSIDNPLPVDRDTLYVLGSITKTIRRPR